MNLREVLSVEIRSNQIRLFNNSPQTFYKIVLQFREHFPLLPPEMVSDGMEAETRQLTTYKQFDDFHIIE